MIPLLCSLAADAAFDPREHLRFARKPRPGRLRTEVEVELLLHGGLLSSCERTPLHVGLSAFPACSRCEPHRLSPRALGPLAGAFSRHLLMLIRACSAPLTLRFICWSELASRGARTPLFRARARACMRARLQRRCLLWRRTRSAGRVCEMVSVAGW